jgi:hypothetical protein
MSIREAGPLGQYPTLPVGGEGLATWSVPCRVAIASRYDPALS